jgi:ubiquinone/menaquinone biosynthesis C-methylase UbiE
VARQLPRSGFSDVDRDDDPAALIHQLDVRSGDAFHQTYKRRAIALLGLQEGDRVLDVGCGAGDDVSLLAQVVGAGGSAVGVDASAAMIAEARARHAVSLPPNAFVVGNAERLPFADGSFDGCLAIRTFQHLADLRLALAEMCRVAKSGGRLVVVDPDHETAVIDVPERHLARAFLNFRADTIRNGWIAHHMPALFKECGLLEVAVLPMTDVRTDYAEVEATLHYEGGIRVAQEQGVLTTEEADRLVHSMRETAASGRFMWAMTFFLTTGRKP